MCCRPSGLKGRAAALCFRELQQSQGRQELHIQGHDIEISGLGRGDSGGIAELGIGDKGCDAEEISRAEGPPRSLDRLLLKTVQPAFVFKRPA